MHKKTLSFCKLSRGERTSMLLHLTSILFLAASTACSSFNPHVAYVKEPSTIIYEPNAFTTGVSRRGLRSHDSAMNDEPNTDDKTNQERGWIEVLRINHCIEISKQYYTINDLFLRYAGGASYERTAELSLSINYFHMVFLILFFDYFPVFSA
ncbi:secreted RxLR effector peptide protein, putative [Phytophthora infestans T30-4]